MRNDNDRSRNVDAAEKGGEYSFDFRSDEAAVRFDQLLNEGSNYVLAYGQIPNDLEDFPEDFLVNGQEDYLDPEFYDPDEETLPPGEMEQIFENCFIM